MKTIYRIAKLELNTLFYSPIAWLLLIVFLFQCGLAYSSSLEFWVTIQDQSQPLKFLTERMFVDPPVQLMLHIFDKLYLYFPLLTMGLFSREINNGTIKLLYSSPIRIRDIVLGKFVAMMIYSLLMTLVLAVIMIVGMVNIEAVDHKLLLSGLLGMYLLLCAYSAIGLFMSSLTSYQVVAAISTLVLFAALNYIGMVWQDISFVRELTNILSMAGRSGNFIHGLITTKDILYFVLIVYLFLGLSIYKLKAGRESKPGYVKWGRYAMVIFSVLLVGYITSRPGFIAYYDATATKVNTLTKNTQGVIRDMGKGELEINTYVNLLDERSGYGIPGQRNIDLARWDPYLRFKPDIHFNYVYYYDSTDDAVLFRVNPGLDLAGIGKKYTKSYKMDFSDVESPAQIRKTIDLRPELNRYVMQLRYKGQTTFLRLYNDMDVYPHEKEISAALKRLIVPRPKILFLTGEFERSIHKIGEREYNVLMKDITFRVALVNQGFDVDTLDSDQEIPGNITALVIADPRTNFSSSAIARIQHYVADGGNLLIAGEPGKQSVVNPLIRPLGVQLMEGTLVQPGKDFSPDLVLSYLTPVAAAFTKDMSTSFTDSIRISMPGAAALSYSHAGDFDVKPLLMTDSNVSWIKKGNLVLDSAAVTFSARDGDKRGAFPTALRLTRNVKGREQRIVITGDADFMNNNEHTRHTVRQNDFLFNTALFSWFSQGQFPIDVNRPGSKDNKIRLTGKDEKGLNFLLLGLLPGLLVITGAVLLIRRKRK